MVTPKTRIGVIAAVLAAVIGATSTHAETRVEGQIRHLAIGTRTEETTLHIENRNLRDVIVYVVSGAGRRKLLGTVSGSSTREFTIPSSLLKGGHPLRIRIHPLGPQWTHNYFRGEGSGVKTHPISVTSGDRIELLLESTLSQSSVGVVAAR